MFSLLQHFTLAANGHELVCRNMHPGIYNTYVYCQRNMETYWKVIFLFQRFPCFQFSGTFARETPLGCEKTSKYVAANTCFLCVSVPICIYGNTFLIHDQDSWIYEQCKQIIIIFMASSKFPSTLIFFLYLFVVCCFCLTDFFPMGMPKPFLIEL